jgi:hypothetical protein
VVSLRRHCRLAVGAIAETQRWEFELSGTYVVVSKLPPDVAVPAGNPLSILPSIRVAAFIQTLLWDYGIE